MSVAACQASDKLPVHLVPRQEADTDLAWPDMPPALPLKFIPQRISNPVLTSTSQQVAGMRFTDHKANQDYEQMKCAWLNLLAQSPWVRNYPLTAVVGKMA